MKTYDECVCDVKVEPEKKERKLMYVLKDWLNTPVTREDQLRTLLIFGQVIIDIMVIIKSRKRK